MAAERFECVEDGLDDSVRVFHLRGRLCDAHGCFAFQERACLAIKQAVGGVVVDLAGVSHLDSCGIGILAALVASSRKAGHPVVLAAAPAPVERLLDAIWFLRIVDHAASVDDGIAMVRAHAGGETRG